MLDLKAFERGRTSSRQFEGGREIAGQVGVYNPFFPGTQRAASWEAGWKAGKMGGSKIVQPL